MKKKIITLFSALCLTIPSFAGNDGWSVSVSGGANINFEGYKYDIAATGVAPAVSAGIGKWINSDLGIKLGYDGMKLKNDVFFKDGISYNAFTANLLWNVSNTMGGEDKDRIFEFVPYVFLGGAFGNAGASFTGGAGLSFPIHLSNALSLVPDFKAAYLRDSIYTNAFKGKTLLVAPTIGFRYSF